MFSQRKTRFIFLIYCTLIMLFYYSYADEITKDEGDQLMDIFIKELATSVESEDQNSFLDFCITQKETCTEDQFTGDKALFNWVLSITPRFKERFWRAYKCVTTNQPSLCPVDGDWTEWAGWSRCQADCEDEGYQVRTRACQNPRPSGGGDDCEGTSMLNRSCIGACIKSSDGRNEAKKYVEAIHEMHPDLKDTCLKNHCVFEQAKNFIKNPKKLSKYWSSLVCVKYAGACPVNGGWGQWSQWSECTGHCGWGEIVRKRKCDDPVSQNGGVFCQGDSYELDKCLDTTCNQGETFSEWSVFSACSESCGKYGTKTSTMACLSHKPCLLDGRMVSEITKTVPCFGGRCPNEGSWGDWVSWTECSAICGTGRRTRIRPCNQPYPYGGTPCPGTATDVAGCTGDSCVQVPYDNDDDDDDDDEDLRRRRSVFPLHENRDAIEFHKRKRKAIIWDQHAAIKRRSGGYEYQINIKHEGMRTRIADASHADGTRDDEVAEIDDNDPYVRPLDGDMEPLYTKWSPWTPCSVSCGTGTRARERSCKDRQTVCRGEVKPTQFCNTEPCPVAGGWNSWQAWTACDVTCGAGTQTRYRTCDNPLPSFGGSCLGLNSQAQHCIMPACKPTEEGKWTSWGDWSDCSATCGGGVKTKTKFRKSMSVTQSQDALCNMMPCPEDGLWGAWGGWSKCDRGCGLGNSFRDRTCTDPAPVYGGKPCQGSGTDLQRCFAGPCKATDGNSHDQDDIGVLFKGKGYLRYPIGPRRCLFLMVFMRFKPIRPKGTLFHHTRSCSETKTDSCQLSILTKISHSNLKLMVRFTKNSEVIHLNYPNAVRDNNWNDLIVVVTPKWLEMTLNRGERVVKSLPSESPSINLNGQLQIAMDQEHKEGFYGMISALRTNFRVLQLTTVTNISGRGFPRHVEGVTKISLPTSVRHQNMGSAYFSHLYFRQTAHLHVKVILLASTHNGLIFFNGGNTSSSFFSLVLEEGVVKMCLSCESSPKCRSAYELKTGSWAVLSLTVRDKIATIRMNEGDAMQVMCTEGRNYQPRSSLYVGGAIGEDWGVIVDLTKNNARFHGMVSVIYLNGVAISYKMGTLIDKDGRVNSLGYSLSDNVEEVDSRPESRVSLRCGEPESLKSDNYVRILWLKNMALVSQDRHTEIVDIDSNSEYTSILELHPGKNHEGIYACVLSVDGELTVVEVFVVLDYAEPADGDAEGRAEWIGFIVIYTLLFIFLLAAFLWIFFRDKIRDLVAKLMNQEEDNDGEDEDEAKLLNDTDTGDNTDADEDPGDNTPATDMDQIDDTGGATDAENAEGTADARGTISKRRSTISNARGSVSDGRGTISKARNTIPDTRGAVSDGTRGILTMHWDYEDRPASSLKIKTIPRSAGDPLTVLVPKLVTLEDFCSSKSHDTADEMQSLPNREQQQSMRREEIVGYSSPCPPRPSRARRRCEIGKSQGFFVPKACLQPRKVGFEPKPCYQPPRAGVEPKPCYQPPKVGFEHKPCLQPLKVGFEPKPCYQPPKVRFEPKPCYQSPKLGVELKPFYQPPKAGVEPKPCHEERKLGFEHKPYHQPRHVYFDTKPHEYKCMTQKKETKYVTFGVQDNSFQKPVTRYHIEAKKTMVGTDSSNDRRPSRRRFAWLPKSTDNKTRVTPQLPTQSCGTGSVPNVNAVTQLVTPKLPTPSYDSGLTPGVNALTQQVTPQLPTPSYDSCLTPGVNALTQQVTPQLPASSCETGKIPNVNALTQQQVYKINSNYHNNTNHQDGSSSSGSCDVTLNSDHTDNEWV